MNTCRESKHVQDYLDGELAAPRVRAFQEHLEGCASCAREVASYRMLFDTIGADLGDFARLDPGPSLTERVLDRVLPSRLRKRWVTALGWIYGTASAVTTFLFVSWITRPEAPVALARWYGEASVRVLQSVLFTFQAVTRSWFDLLQGWDFVGRLVGRVSPVARALARPLADPTVGWITVAALLACVLVLWWMRPKQAREEVRHVSVLGF